jgi:hypothetical protein
VVAGSLTTGIDPLFFCHSWLAARDLQHIVGRKGRFALLGPTSQHLSVFRQRCIVREHDAMTASTDARLAKFSRK